MTLSGFALPLWQKIWLKFSGQPVQPLLQPVSHFYSRYSTFTAGTVTCTAGTATYTADIATFTVGIATFTAGTVTCTAGTATYTADIATFTVGIATFTAGTVTCTVQLAQSLIKPAYFCKSFVLSSISVMTISKVATQLSVWLLCFHSLVLASVAVSKWLQWLFIWQ